MPQHKLIHFILELRNKLDTHFRSRQEAYKSLKREQDAYAKLMMAMRKEASFYRNIETSEEEILRVGRDYRNRK